MFYCGPLEIFDILIHIEWNLPGARTEPNRRQEPRLLTRVGSGSYSVEVPRSPGSGRESSGTEIGTHDS